MRITAAICTYNREKYLPQVLNSLLIQSIDPSQFDIFIIDNNSPGNTKEIFENFKFANPDISIHYFLECNQGLSFARNRAIIESKQELITFIDDDAFLDKNYLKVVVEEFKENENIVAIGGEILLHFETLKPKWENKYLNSLLGFYSPSKFSFIYKSNFLRKQDYPRGSNMSFRKDVFKKIGNFNVELGRIGSNLLGGEEKDLFYRIFEIKGSIVKYVPEAIVFHCVPETRTTKDFIIKQAIGTGLSENNRIRVLGKYPMLKAYFIELLKWIGSIFLFFSYLLKGKKEKGKMILLFRKYVSIGLMRGQ